MKTKLTILTCLGLLSSVGAVHATVVVLFNNAFLGGMSSNLADSTGAVTNGMTYGVLVDSSGNGFLSQYDAFSGGALFNTTATDDFLFLAADTTSDSSQGFITEGDGTTLGGNGGVTGVSFSLGGVSGGGTVGANDVFRLVWISNGKMGTLADASFLVPADSNTSTLDSPFVGVDPVRTALNSYSGTSQTPTGAGITLTAVPEPSAVLLGAIGALGLLRRRRI